MGINGGDTNPVFVGDPLTVEAIWALNLKGLEFYLLDCHVSHQGHDVFVLDNSCYANALGSIPETVTKFSFRTFAVDSVDENDIQNVSCGIQICSGEKCALEKVSTTTCPDTLFYDWQKFSNDV